MTKRVTIWDALMSLTPQQPKAGFTTPRGCLLSSQLQSAGRGSQLVVQTLQQIGTCGPSISSLHRDKTKGDCGTGFWAPSLEHRSDSWALAYYIDNCGSYGIRSCRYAIERSNTTKGRMFTGEIAVEVQGQNQPLYVDSSVLLGSSATASTGFTPTIGEDFLELKPSHIHKLHDFNDAHINISLAPHLRRLL